MHHGPIFLLRLLPGIQRARITRFGACFPLSSSPTLLLTPSPPRWLRNFTTFVRCVSRSSRVQRPNTTKVLISIAKRPTPAKASPLVKAVRRVLVASRGHRRSPSANRWLVAGKEQPGRRMKRRKGEDWRWWGGARTSTTRRREASVARNRGKSIWKKS